MLFHKKIEICEVRRNLIKNNESGLILILKRLIFNNRNDMLIYSDKEYLEIVQVLQLTSFSYKRKKLNATVYMEDVFGNKREINFTY